MYYQSKRAKTMKLLEENTGVSLYDLGLSSGFSDMIAKAKMTKKKKKKAESNLIKI